MPLNRRLPKRGFNHDDRFAMFVVNLDVLDKFFADGTEVTPLALVAAGLAKETKGGVKILGRGELTKKLAIQAHAVSDGARAKIEAAGGSVTLVAVLAPAVNEA